MLSMATRKYDVLVTSRQYHHGDLRKALLLVAASRLEDVGAKGLSLRELARELGVSHAAPSRHFQSKPALLDALAVEGFALLASELEAVAGRTEARAPREREKLHGLAMAYVDFTINHPALVALMFEQKRASGATDELLAASHRPMEVTIKVIDGMRKPGGSRSGSTEEIAAIGFSLFHGIATLAMSDLLGGASLSEVVERGSRIFWRGLDAID